MIRFALAWIVAWEALRLARLEPRMSLDRLAEAMRRRRLLPRVLRRADAAAEVVERLLPYLPPRHLRPCLRRSLLLLALWSRCGLRPVLHLGVTGDDPHSGHAWVTAPGLPQPPASWRELVTL